MFMVAPRGSTKDETSLEAPRFVTHSMLSGNVPTLEALEKANIMAGAIFLKKWTGLMFAINLTVNE